MSQDGVHLWPSESAGGQMIRGAPGLMITQAQTQAQTSDKMSWWSLPAMLSVLPAEIFDDNMPWFAIMAEEVKRTFNVDPTYETLIESMPWYDWATDLNGIPWDPMFIGSGKSIKSSTLAGVVWTGLALWKTRKMTLGAGKATLSVMGRSYSAIKERMHRNKLYSDSDRNYEAIKALPRRSGARGVDATLRLTTALDRLTVLIGTGLATDSSIYRAKILEEIADNHSIEP